MYKYQLYSILAFLAVIGSHTADNNISKFTSAIVSIIFASGAVMTWGKKE